ncbi:hypothetical protein MKY34_15520 [Sporosarcina sp. FSL K6-1522]|uniref:hypothetical protein n=1 Tax=Sporosarcina sp. FSL K6-1522 TaxID=2921554 RepID=UPI00315AD677
MLKRRRKEKRKRQNEQYTRGDFFLDVVLGIPELIILPFRMLFFGVKSMIRLISNWS